MKKILFALALISTLVVKAQNDTVLFTQLGNFYYDTSLQWSVYTPLIDRLGRPYVYTASVDLGMVTFDISNVMAPVPACTLSVATLGGWKATSLAQNADTLYISTGGFQSAGENAGLAIYDVTNPVSPVLLDRWDTNAYTHGTAHVLVKGGYAYLGAMDDGIIILDVSNQTNIRFVSHYVPPTTPNQGYTPHSRGLYLSGDTLLDADDGGGLRIIDVSNKLNPVLMGSYLNAAPASIGTKPFYNKVLRLGNYAYIPVDYAGFEIDDVSDPANVVTMDWNNIWNNVGIGPWFGSDGHTNEIVWTGPTTNVLMVSGGDSQVLAIDPSNPSNARVMGQWGVPNTDLLVAWGIDEYNGLVCSGYIRDVIQILQPYYSRYGGIQLLNYSVMTAINENSFVNEQLKLFPNPTSSVITIALPTTSDDHYTIEIIDVLGNVIRAETVDANVIGRNCSLDLSSDPAGVYMIRVSSAHAMCAGRVVKN